MFVSSRLSHSTGMRSKVVSIPCTMLQLHNLIEIIYSSRSGNPTGIFYIVGGFFTNWVIREAPGWELAPFTQPPSMVNFIYGFSTMRTFRHPQEILWQIPGWGWDIGCVQHICKLKLRLLVTWPCNCWVRDDFIICVTASSLDSCLSVLANINVLVHFYL